MESFTKEEEEEKFGVFYILFPFLIFFSMISTGVVCYTGLSNEPMVVQALAGIHYCLVFKI